MKRLIQNQILKIDNPAAPPGSPAALLLHKRMNQDGRKYGDADIVLQPDGKVSIHTQRGDYGDRLHQPVTEELAGQQILKQFSGGILAALSRFRPNLAENDYLDICRSILDMFGFEGSHITVFRTIWYKNGKGVTLSYTAKFRSPVMDIEVLLKKTYYQVKGVLREQSS